MSHSVDYSICSACELQVPYYDIVNKSNPTKICYDCSKEKDENEYKALGHKLSFSLEVEYCRYNDGSAADDRECQFCSYTPKRRYEIKGKVIATKGCQMNVDWIVCRICYPDMIGLPALG